MVVVGWLGGRGDVLCIEIRYVTFLQENIGRIFPDGVANRSQLSYVINRGISAHGPEIEHFAFEDELPVDEWPNLVTLEFSLNINGGVKSQKEIDEVIYYINRKYERRNVLPPRYLFLDFWRAKDYYNKTDGCIVQDKDELLNTIRYTRGTATPPAIRTSPGVEEIARFYGYPLIGTRELFWDVFFEYYITHGQCLQRPTKDKPPLCWPMQDDCVHLNCYSGRLVSNVVILPLLMNEIVKYKQSGRLDNPLDDCTYTDRHSAAVKMFPEDTYSDYDILSQVEIWSISPHDVVQGCDGFSFHTNKTSHICILDRNEGWHYSGTAGHFDGLHDTLSSSAAQYSSIVFGVAVYDQGDPSKNVRIHLDIDYLVSWNTAVFGEMECIFHNQGLNESETRFLLLPNKCDGELVTSTGMCTIRLPVELKHNQFYRLECKKLNNGMVGFGKFTILRKRVL